MKSSNRRVQSSRLILAYRRIGVAVGQTLTGSANALAVVPFANNRTGKQFQDYLASGNPLRWSSVCLWLRMVVKPICQRLPDALAVNLKVVSGSCVFEDERLTSFSAEQRFVDARARGGMRRKDAALKDAMAAQIILESWLQS